MSIFAIKNADAIEVKLIKFRQQQPKAIEEDLKVALGGHVDGGIIGTKSRRHVGHFVQKGIQKFEANLGITKQFRVDTLQRLIFRRRRQKIS